MRSRWLLSFLFSFTTCAMQAQSSSPQAAPAQSPPSQSQPPAASSEPSVQSLLDRIQQLENRLNQLEERDRQKEAAQASVSTPTATPAETPAAAPGAPAPAVAATPAAMQGEDHANMGEIRDVERRFPSLQIRGFGDVDFSATDQKGSISGFNLGQFVLHFASPLSEKVSYFGEVSFTAEPNSYDLSVERTIIRYDYNDYFKLSFGKYHTPIGYWNAEFHHGAWLQTTISRPEMVKFGGTFIPTHFVGIQAEGNIPSGGLGLGYNVGLGNGRSSFLSKAGDSGDSNDNRAWVAEVFSRPTRFYGLQVGGSFYRDKLTPQPGQNYGEWIRSAYVVWTKEKPEFLAEYANVHHNNVLNADTWDSQAFYIQAAYRLPWQQNKWKPYYRFEYIHKPETDPTLVDVMDLTGSTFGVRYDITNYAAFKGEYRNMRHGVDEPRVNGAFFQTAFTF
jgi:Phosphate-selective porin O and P